MASVTIVTVVKDHASGLIKTHASLIGQTLVDWEMIIVVGISTDDTLSVAKVLQGNDSRIRVLEQGGAGIYGAMNEGLELASGEFTWFMNAGDTFVTLFVLAHAVGEISQIGTGLVVGGYQIDNGSADQIYSYPGGNVTTLDFAFNRRGGCHQAMIFRTEDLKLLRGFDTSYSLAADFDLVLKVIKRSRAKRVSEVYASIEPGGLADQGIFLVHQQKHEIRRNLLGGPFIFLASVLWTVLARVKIMAREMIEKSSLSH
jgi:glycosyltransferase involved in cell wall biosynthesis